ncbi:hypothetical protein C8J57DRAFT_1277323 [Mycena rebaudengoi]|nr:hypothetical protein C8J57DRAFT_1277323 [Mycena rebaudengoi]
MSQTEIQIPLDVVLDISAALDLQHSLRLLATCKNYQSLSSSKAFWLGTLNRMTDVHRRPLPCPGGADLSTMALEKLRGMAIHAYRLMQNWSAENPTPVSARTFQMSPGIRELRLIPGTHLMINVVLNGDIFCWDTIAGTCLGSITSPLYCYITIGSNPFEVPGQCFFGVGYDFVTHFELAVICINYDDSANVTIAKIHSYEWAIPDSPHTCVDVALDGNQIGMIVEQTFRMPLALVYCNHHDKMIHCINTQLLGSRHSPPCCLIHAGQFYIASRHKLAMDISHVRTDSSSSQAMQSLSSSIRRVAQVLHPHPPRFPYQLRPPRYDVFGVTRDSLPLDADPDINCVHFWPAIDTNAELTLGPTCSYQHDCHISRMHVGSSGRFVVIATSYNLQPSVGLVHYVAHPTPHITFRRLDIPFDLVNSYAIYALDDRLGVLYLGNARDNTIAVVSYT